MAKNNLEILEAAFAEAVSLDGEARAAMLNRFETEHPELIAELHRLLAVDDIDDAQIERPIAQAARAATTPNTDVWLGRQIGAWTIQQRIAEGGMGAVFLATRSDEQYEQTAAVKIMTAQLLAKDAIARFRAERQILASLNHPNIAQLLDGGSTAEDLPYLVMEYVDGLPIDQYCDQSQLSISERLTLFRKVCNAIDVAHRNLVVHRDIKPSNILVDRNGEPKLLDFGIAKMLEGHASPGTAPQTQVGSRLMTPEYASPEQVRGEAVSVATDIYSLGVLLYQLLAGHSPYAEIVSQPGSMANAILELEPRRPSDVVTSPTPLTEGLSADELSMRRRSSPLRLRKRLQGDLDNIVLKTLRKERDQRYGSAQLLAQDIENYLEQRPVIAHPPSWQYRANKFLRRNRTVVSVVGVAAIALTGLLTYHTITVGNERDAAQLQAERANEVATFLSDLFAEADPRLNLGEPLTANQVLERGAARVTDDLGTRPALQAKLLVTITTAYHTQYKQDEILDLLGPVVPQLIDDLGRENTDVIELVMRLGYARWNVSDKQLGLAELKENLKVAETVYGSESLMVGRHLMAIARFQTGLNDYKDTEALFQRALTVLPVEDPNAIVSRAHALMNYGSYLRKHDRLAEEEPLLLEAMALQEARVGRIHPDFTALLNNLGNHYYRRDLPEKALVYMEELLASEKQLYGEDGIPYGIAAMNYSNALLALDRHSDSLEAIDIGIGVFSAHRADDGTRYAYALENKANVLRSLGRFEEAEPLYLNVLDIIEGIYGKEHFEYAISEESYAGNLSSQGRTEEARALFKHALQVQEETFGPDHSNALKLRIRIMNMSRQLGDLDRALEIGAPAFAKLKATLSPTNNFVMDGAFLTGLTHRDIGNYEESNTIFLEALAHNQDRANPITFRVKIEPVYAESLCMQDRCPEAIEIMERLRAHLAEASEPNPASVERVEDYLARVRNWPTT